jgi:cysteine desulfurase/selenocysteine lyase
MCSNVTGTIVNIKEVREKYRDAILVVDAAQAVAHLPIDVKELDVDILSFSAHKMYGPMGIGVLYIKSSLAERLPPFRYGGGMIESVDLENSTWAKIPEKFEAGTPNVEGAWGLKAAIEYVLSIGFEKIVEHEKVLAEYMNEKLLQIEGILIYHPTSPREHCGVISFTIEGIHAHDNSYLLGQRNIATRAGHHCAQVLHKEVLKVSATTRCSIGIYNTKEEVDKLINVLGEIIRNFK